MAIAVGSIENYVPHYDIYGHQHYRDPFKDKSYILKEDVRHPRWLSPAPAVKSRSELQQARQRGRVPDSSYDFDGDGTVGQLDHFIGRCFDKDNDGRLTETERGRAREALDRGFLDKYVRGLDSTGQVARGCAVLQKRGVITMADNTQDVSAWTYPPHHNAHMHPPHNTRTALQISRVAEAKGQGALVADRYARACAPVDEPQPLNHRSEPRTCSIGHIRERAEADHQASRVRAGLLPVSSMVNPEREHKTVGLRHLEQPLFVTRGQLLETRKEGMKRECEELALKAEETCVPLSVRRREQEEREFEFRRPDHLPMTLGRLKDERRRDRIEHSMQNFPLPRGGPREYPRFSDNPEVPFWLADGPSPGFGMARPAPAMVRAVSEPALKVTDVPFGHFAARESVADLPEAAQTMAAAGKYSPGAEARIGSKTVKRWTAEYIERGEGRNKPRLFDSIQPVRIGPKDLESLDVTSSLEPVRNAALCRRVDDNRKNAGNPKRSRLWSDPSAAQQSMSDLASGSATPAQRPFDWLGTGGKTLRPTNRTHSEPAPRNFDKADVPHEPRFFGSVEHMGRPASQTAVRCGGFQTFTAPERQPQPQKATIGRKASRSSAAVPQ